MSESDHSLKPLICVSVMAATIEELGLRLAAAKSVADVIEIRFDHLDAIERDPLIALLTDFRRSFNGRILATFRPANGGQGGHRELTETERREFWEFAPRVADWCDLESDLEIRPASFEKTIRSHHYFGPRPSDAELSEKIRSIITSGCDIVKIAIAADDASDALAIWKPFEAMGDGRPVVPIAMGEAGKWTRVLAGSRGAPLTYASAGSGLEAAPGQIAAGELRDTYRIERLDRKTEVYGIIGGNTGYSMSPFIHTAAFAAAARNAVFVPFQVRDLSAFFNRLVARRTRETDLNLHGFAVTIPHKQSVIGYLDDLDESAVRIGAVNTIRIRDGRLTGFNTDADGFIAPLLARGVELAGTRVAVFGAGGASRACVHALAERRAAVTVIARNQDHASALAGDFGCRAGVADGAYEIIVNATPLGTTGDLAELSPVPLEMLKHAHLAYDLVYNPFRTRFLRDAETLGVKTVGGFEMLIAQAVRQQVIWTGGCDAEDAMRNAALNKLR